MTSLRQLRFFKKLKTISQITQHNLQLQVFKDVSNPKFLEFVAKLIKNYTNKKFKKEQLNKQNRHLLLPLIHQIIKKMALEMVDKYVLIPYDLLCGQTVKKYKTKTRLEGKVKVKNAKPKRKPKRRKR